MTESMHHRRTHRRAYRLDAILLHLFALLLSAATIVITVIFPHRLDLGWVVVLTGLVLVPSYALGRRLSLGNGHLDTLVLGLPLGFGVHFPLFALAATLHWTPDTWVILASVLSFVVFASTVRARKPNTISRPRISISAGLLILMLLVAVITALSGRDSDDWAYGAYLADTSENLPLMGSDPVLGPDIPVFPRQSLNLWLGVLGAGARATSAPVPIILQDQLPPVLAALAVAAAFLLGTTLGKRPVWGLVTAAVLVLWTTMTPFHSQPGNGLFYRISEDKYAAMLILGPVLFAGLMRLLERLDRRIWIFGLLTGVGIAAVHPFTYVILLIGLWGWAVSLLLTRTASSRSTVLAALGFTVGAVIPLLVHFTMSQVGPVQGSEAYVEIRKTQFENNTGRLWIRGARVIMVHPNMILDPFTLAMLALAVMAPFWKPNVRTLFPAALVITVLLSVFNPLAAPILAETLGVGVIWRFIWLLPVPYAIAAWAGALEPLTPHSRRVLAILVLLIAAGLQLPKAQDSWAHWQRTRAIWKYEPELVSLYQTAAALDPSGYVLAPNLPVGIKIPSFAPDARLVAFRGTQGTVGHMPRSRVEEGIRRVEDLDAFYAVSFGQSIPTDDDLDIIERYRVRLLFLSASDPRLEFFTSHAQVLSHEGSWYLLLLPEISQLRASVDQAG